MVIWDEGRWMPFLTTPIVFYMKLEIRNQFTITGDYPVLDAYCEKNIEKKRY